MLAQPLLLALAATSVAAFYHEGIYPAAFAAKRDLELVARQTQVPSLVSGTPVTTATACLESLMSLYSSLPTPPPQLVSWEQTASVTDLCSISIPSSLSSAFSSYETEASSWYSDHSSAIDAALSACPQYSSAAASMCSVTTGGAGGGTATTTGGGNMTTTGSGASGTRMATTTGQTTGTTSSAASKSSGGASHSGSGTSGATAAASSTHNAAPRETGFVAGAVAVAGFLGVVAAL